MKLKLKSPLRFWSITQRFGENGTVFYQQSGMKGHNGIDFHAPDGTPIYATHDGRVTFAGYDGGGGLGVVIRTEKKFTDIDGKSSYFKTIYWHLKKDSLKVTGGQTVKAGDLIALADNTGRSTGSHLHFGLKPIAKGENDWDWANTKQNNGYLGAIDPIPYIDWKFEPTRTLKLNDTGDDVKQLQGLLASNGFWLPFDGKFGKKTETIVKTFQKNNSLVVDGVVGKKTLAVLNRL